MSTSYISLEDLADMKPIECPQRGGVNFPCVICKECEIGESSLEFGDGVMIEKSVNSVLLHLSLHLKEGDPFEPFVLKLLKSSISKIVPYVQKGDWEEGDLTIMISDDKKDDAEMVEHINEFLNGFVVRWRQLSIESKRMLKDWSDRMGKQLALQYFKEFSM
ncbi:MAG: hypothetical protein INQ03_04675 [Candidatus Heimdallarchaeota archaeon]|nr:hypothetical protein [Candidatus Heimdallarchaeota archaeon]